ncbi:MAG: hypothetical protein J6Y78_09385 [Paludibacteraceae bacterium]|nr:hypothetical protein [Paludibacteraceae bacterium]
MAIELFDNLDYRGPKPDFVRQQYDTLEEMREVIDNQLPPLYLAYCLETSKIYLYNVKNARDPVTGKFRELSTSSQSQSTQVTMLPLPSQAQYDRVVQYVGPTRNGLVKGYFYHCSVDSGSYFWEQILTGNPEVITPKEIKRLFLNRGIV